ncbi:MAG: type II secretion system protein [Desulfobacterales bacterium]|jgi:prepilin-type N-terminal cleavage/methylation domain-containing protein
MAMIRSNSIPNRFFTRCLSHRLGGWRHRPHAGPRTGFTLVEIIVSLLLVGLIGTFTLFFLADGIEGFLISQQAADSAFKAQIALDRVRLELLGIESLEASPVNDTSLQYTSSDPELTGSRALLFSGGTLYLRVNGTDYPLIDGVTSPVLQLQYDDMDNDALDEVAYIDVGFTIGNQPPYSVRIYPRGMVAKFS